MDPVGEQLAKSVLVHRVQKLYGRAPKSLRAEVIPRDVVILNERLQDMGAYLAEGLCQCHSLHWCLTVKPLLNRCSLEVRVDEGVVGKDGEKVDHLVTVQRLHGLERSLIVLVECEAHLLDDDIVLELLHIELTVNV